MFGKKPVSDGGAGVGVLICCWQLEKKSSSSSGRGHGHGHGFYGEVCFVSRIDAGRSCDVFQEFRVVFQESCRSQILRLFLSFRIVHVTESTCSQYVPVELSFSTTDIRSSHTLWPIDWGARSGRLGFTLCSTRVHERCADVTNN